MAVDSFEEQWENWEAKLWLHFLGSEEEQQEQEKDQQLTDKLKLLQTETSKRKREKTKTEAPVVMFTQTLLAVTIASQALNKCHHQPLLLKYLL